MRSVEGLDNAGGSVAGEKPNRFYFNSFPLKLPNNGDHMNFQGIFQRLFMLSMFFGLAFAAASIEAGLCDLYNLVNTVLTVVVFLLIVTAAIVYAGGQLLGAETRARASVWATSMFIGALIGVLIFVIMPMILGTMLPADQDLTTVCAAYPAD